MTPKPYTARCSCRVGTSSDRETATGSCLRPLQTPSEWLTWPSDSCEGACRGKRNICELQTENRNVDEPKALQVGTTMIERIGSGRKVKGGHNLKPVELREGRVITEAIEINAAWHCNIRCRWCSHSSPGMPTRYASATVAASALEALSEFMRVDHVRVLGGEPLLHPELVDLIRAVRGTGISERIRVISNGLLLHRMPPELWDTVDEIHVSAYPATRRFLERTMPELRAMAITHNVTLLIKYFDHFRIPYREDDGDNVLTQRIYRTCQIGNVWRCLTLEGGRLYRCPQAASERLLVHSPVGCAGEDYLEVATISSAVDIATWLNRDLALVSCRTCAGSVGQLVPHQPLLPREMDGVASSTRALDLDFLDLLEADPAASNSCVDGEVLIHGRR